MSLIDSIERDGHILQEGDILVLGQGLGCNVEELGAPAAHVVLDNLDGLLGQRGVDKMGDAVFLAVTAHGIDLVFHQSDERRDDNRRAFHESSRQLIA